MVDPVKWHISRRRLAGNALGLATACALPWGLYQYLKPGPPKVNVYRPGMDLGHMLRNYSGMMARSSASQPEPVATWQCDLMIIGSGAAALTAAWKLKREGVNNFAVLEGPEPDGNNAGLVNGELRYPTAAHYLAMPSRESAHLREMLVDLGILLGDPDDEVPLYDEMVVVHAQEERLLRNGLWQDAMLPQKDEDSERFFQLVEKLSRATGEDGRSLFAIPRALSSSSSQWKELDQITFAQWLHQNDLTSASLLWYLNYCCRDDYGQGIGQVSAWAGLHYFACRTGSAQHADKGAVLTWPDGLATLNRKLREYIGFERSCASSAWDKPVWDEPQLMSGTLLRAKEHDTHVELLIAIPKEGDSRQFQIARVHAKKVISAIPVYVAAHVIDRIDQYGFDRVRHMPEYAPWMVSNFILTAYPQEIAGAPLSWDNVVHNGPGLGYVVSTHQLIRVVKPERTAFTAYYALDEDEPMAVRNWMMTASDDELLAKASGDLLLAYPDRFWHQLQQVDITLRGHAMISPTPGYLTNQGLQALQLNDSRILFAHSDLSGYSVFEEAAWWGYQAALKYMAV